MLASAHAPVNNEIKYLGYLRASERGRTRLLGERAKKNASCQRRRRHLAREKPRAEYFMRKPICENWIAPRYITAAAAANRAANKLEAVAVGAKRAFWLPAIQLKKRRIE
jgi:hypothetical protein